MAYIALKTLKPCECGGRPTIKRVYGWWHICCKKCGWYPYVPMPRSDGRSRVHGWNSRSEAIEAWIHANES